MDEISREAAARMCRDALRAERRDNPRGSAEIEQPPPIHETVMLSDPGRCAGEQPLIRRRNSRGVANEKLDIHQFLGGPRAEKVAKSRPVSCGGVQLYEVRLALAVAVSAPIGRLEARRFLALAALGDMPESSTGQESPS